MIDKDLAVCKQKFLDVYHIPKHVRVDETFPLGSIECYTLPRIKGEFSSILVNIPFYVTLQQLMILDDSNGKGMIYGRAKYGVYCKLMCEFFRVRYVIKLTNTEQNEYKRSIYEEV